ncbi:hypothetical protein ASE47_19950 [Ensifer sp. Root258]|nr:hypothetical protein ASE47_19950 [Ensifer sp. Root258]
MTDGHNLFEDYSHTGLTLRQQIAFLRRDLEKRNIVTCEEAMNTRDGRWVYADGLVLVREKPGSVKGVIFITIEDETGVANVVVWPTLFEKRRRVVLGASSNAKAKSSISSRSSYLISLGICRRWLTATLTSSFRPDVEMSSPMDLREGMSRIGRSLCRRQGTSASGICISTR